MFMLMLRHARRSSTLLVAPRAVATATPATVAAVHPVPGPVVGRTVATVHPVPAMHLRVQPQEQDDGPNPDPVFTQPVHVSVSSDSQPLGESTADIECQHRARAQRAGNR